MMSPTPVSHTVVIIIRHDNFANFPLYSTKFISVSPLSTIKIKKTNPNLQNTKIKNIL